MRESTSPYSGETKAILVATNLRDHPALMIHATAQARACGAGILLAHVVPEYSSAAARLPRAPSIREAQTHLEDVARHIRWQGIPCEPFVAGGQPAEQLAALAALRNVDRVIVAVRNSRVPGQSLIGSVAENLILALDLPVFVIGRHVDPLPSGKVLSGRILLPVSLRHDCSPIIDFACRLARQSHSRVALLHVLNPSNIDADERDRAYASARMRLAAIAAPHSGLPSPIEIVLREGNIARAIVEEAVCPHRDFIVLGSSSLSRGSDPLNSIVHQVVGEARCPVITLRSPLAAGSQPAFELSELSARSGT